MASPLLISTELLDADDATLSILLAPEIIAINQDALGVQGARVSRDGGDEVFAKPLADGSGQSKSVSLLIRVSQ